MDVAVRPVRVALVGNPNSGKTALFNALTGAHQKVANYAGVTVERKEGRVLAASGRSMSVLDLPGTYSLRARSPDEEVTRDAVLGRLAGEAVPDVIVAVADATNLRLVLRLILELKAVGRPMVLALNMYDIAQRQGLRIDLEKLRAELGVPIVTTVATRKRGIEELVAEIETAAGPGWVSEGETWTAPDAEAIRGAHRRAEQIMRATVRPPERPDTLTGKIDGVLLHPVIGLVILLALLFVMFQAVFAWATPAMDAIEAGTGWVGGTVGGWLPEGLLRSFLVDGLVAGLGGVVVFLPQILILFLFILVLEESGYLPRAAFLLDRLMGGVGLSGRSFIPLLSSFACAIPGIMAARTIANTRDRLVTIMIAPIMTCSARLPVYALLIGAFIPKRDVGPGLELQGLVLFALYVAGIVGSMAVAWVAKRFSGGGQVRALMMELPSYHLPRARNVLIGLWQRAAIFMRRVGGVILTLTVAMWFLATFPSPPEGATGPAIEYSAAGMLGKALAVVLEPIGFNWQISIALVPGMAAREVAVSALGTVYALSGEGDAAEALTPLIAQGWSLATALSLLAWFVFAPQCLSTLATVKRETGGWKWPLVMAGYLFALAYAAAFVTYRVAVALGGG